MTNGTAVIDLSAQGAGTIRMSGVAPTDPDAETSFFAESTTRSMTASIRATRLLEGEHVGSE